MKKGIREDRFTWGAGDLQLVDKPRVTVPAPMPPKGAKVAGTGLFTRYYVWALDDDMVKVQVVRYRAGKWKKDGDPETMHKDNFEDWTIDKE